ncbi:hypothetical protein IFR05_003544 [Cadophora sp. M221]|nr:hypothetical protein IFR05_003544 [Cadophora sp. M221]
MNLNSFLKPESAFSWAKREAESSKIVYNSLSTQDIHGADVPTWIVVTERNRKGRLDIALHVLSDKPRVENELPIDRGYGHIIPLLTLTEEELRSQSLVMNHHPLYHLPTRGLEIWNYWQEETKLLMGDICVVDSIEMSVFPRISFGSKVRVKSRHDIFPPAGSMEEYCLKALPIDDRETRRLVEILFGYDETGTKGDFEASGILDASRILESRPDSFLQLHPVHWAVIGGQVEIIRILLDSGLSAVGKSQRRLTPLHLAFLLPGAHISNLLWGTIHPSGEETPWAELQEDLEPTINNEDYPLHFAAAYATSTEFWEPTELLSISQMGGGPLTNRLGERPIHRAAAMGNIAAVRTIMNEDSSRYVSEVGKMDLQGRTPLWHAACGDNTGAIAKILMDFGAFPDIADNDGLAPVHVACRQGSIRFLKRLTASGANLNLPAGALGLLPSHFAAVFGHKLCMELLLANQAEITSYIADGTAMHALHLAIANGQEACARAIWLAVDPKPFEGWSLCILLETSGPVLKWMYLEVNDQRWLAAENPRQAGGTESFVCFSDEASSPKLWVRPSISKATLQEDVEADFDDDIDNDVDNDIDDGAVISSYENEMKDFKVLAREDSNDTNKAVIAGPEHRRPIRSSLPESSEFEPKIFNKARRMMKSVFQS